jgi:hypothetical protein
VSEVPFVDSIDCRIPRSDISPLRRVSDAKTRFFAHRLRKLMPDLSSAAAIGTAVTASLRQRKISDRACHLSFFSDSSTR